ncbi:hypothetical protein [Mycobacterium kubicae]|nr:hypothetical protein [Mycobacterium kubicae]
MNYGHWYGDADQDEEPSELGYIPEYVQFLPPSEGGPYKPKAPRAEKIIG